MELSEARNRIEYARVKLLANGWTHRNLENAFDGLDRDETVDRMERSAAHYKDA